MNIILLFFRFFKLLFKSDLQKDFEILALCSQLAIFQQQLINQKAPKPRLNNGFRRLWVFLSKAYPSWKDALIIFRPDTIIRWHKKAFRLFWRRKSNIGRPKISPATITLVKRVHKENPTLPPEKIHERLVDLAIADAPAPNTADPRIQAPVCSSGHQPWPA